MIKSEPSQEFSKKDEKNYCKTGAEALYCRLTANEIHGVDRGSALLFAFNRREDERMKKVTELTAELAAPQIAERG